MADVRLYDAVKANIVVDGRTIQGFQDGDMFSYTYKEEKVKTTVDALSLTSFTACSSFV